MSSPSLLFRKGRHHYNLSESLFQRGDNQDNFGQIDFMWYKNAYGLQYY